MILQYYIGSGYYIILFVSHVPNAPLLKMYHANTTTTAAPTMYRARATENEWLMPTDVFAFDSWARYIFKGDVAHVIIADVSCPHGTAAVTPRPHPPIEDRNGGDSPPRDSDGRRAASCFPILPGKSVPQPASTTTVSLPQRRSHAVRRPPLLHLRLRQHNRRHHIHSIFAARSPRRPGRSHGASPLRKAEAGRRTPPVR
jgi:hypothetical protein